MDTRLLRQSTADAEAEAARLSRVAGLETQLVDLMLENEELSERAQDLEKKNARLKADVRELTGLLRQAGAECQEWKDEAARLEAENAQLHAANAKLCDILEHGVGVARNAAAALAAQRFEIDRLRGGGVLDDKDQSRETD